MCRVPNISPCQVPGDGLQSVSGDALHLWVSFCRWVDFTHQGVAVVDQVAVFNRLDENPLSKNWAHSIGPLSVIDDHSRYLIALCSSHS